MITGYATPKGTKKFAERQNEDTKKNYKTVQDLILSNVGIGTYLGNPDSKTDYLVQDAVKLHIDKGPFHLGTVGRKPMPVIIKNYFHNVPDEGILGPWAIVAPGISFPEQYYMDAR